MDVKISCHNPSRNFLHQAHPFTVSLIGRKVSFGDESYRATAVRAIPPLFISGLNRFNIYSDSPFAISAVSCGHFLFACGLIHQIPFIPHRNLMHPFFKSFRLFWYHLHFLINFVCFFFMLSLQPPVENFILKFPDCIPYIRIFPLQIGFHIIFRADKI